MLTFLRIFYLTGYTTGKGVLYSSLMIHLVETPVPQRFALATGRDSLQMNYSRQFVNFLK